MVHLGVNIDHVATLREARRGREPDPVHAAMLAELGGADSITVHLREDRRHIQDRDLDVLLHTVATTINLELATADDVVAIACRAKPAQATLVPERREEVTTEGGLDLTQNRVATQGAIERLRDAGVTVSLFIDPDPAQIDAAAELGVTAVELHTGAYAHAFSAGDAGNALLTLQAAADRVHASGMRLHAGHGLNYQNVGPVAALANMFELNIGHSIVCRALWTGFEPAVREMKRLIDAASSVR
ncbi:Pyridoxine 5'-phosphate synthase [Pirellulimonas nuda]|uniref:Pyridoxine 5'-phosphate synthase n=1 Tax=Pirellulimonas nuda TaxID=2528009 RepID=A0A518DEK3_9BACT|nr:pyridoxine 5'-phosphate synthase [Pirellulimonas nuda]QDU89903.1 Pyridoxine 5'-phosphate synthase [Pirellulimonas nuda]